MKRLIYLFLTLCMVCSAVFCLPFTAMAEGTIISLSKKQLAVNENLTVTVTITADEAMYATEAYVTFDGTVISFVSGGSANAQDGGRVKIVGTPGGSPSQSYALTFKALKEGVTSVTVSDVSYVGETQRNIKGASVGGVTIATPAPTTPSQPTTSTPTTPAPSSNAKLSSLKVSGSAIFPEFSADKTTYSASVTNDVTECTITATPADAKAKVTGTGKITLEEGENKREIVVTAENGTKKTYVLTIKRLAVGETLDGETNDDLAVTIDGNGYHILPELPEGTEIAGFTASTVAYKEQEVAVLADDYKHFVIYALSNDADNLVDYYQYDKENDVFTKLNYVKSENRFIIFAKADEKLRAPSGYSETKITIEDQEITAWKALDEGTAEFLFVYCFVNGDYCFYRYDTLEKTLQRDPDFTLVTDIIEGNKDESISNNVFSRFMKLSTLGKAVIVALGVAAIAAIALIAFFALKIMDDRDFEANPVFTSDYEDEIFDGEPIFDEVSVIDTELQDLDVNTTPEE